MNIKNLKQQIDELDGIDVFSKLIGKTLKPGKKILSPLRGENHPSFNVWRSRNGKVLYKDFAAETGDVYAFVMKMYQCNFKSAVEHIANVMNIIDLSDANEPPPLRRFIEKIPKLIIPQKVKIEIVPKDFSKEELDYWKQYNIHTNILDQYRVQSCKSVTMIDANGKKKTTWSPMTFAFTYPSGNIKIYSPLNLQWKFFGNTDTNDIFGYSQLMSQVNAQNVIICAGQKDVMALAHILNLKPDIIPIALNSETALLKEDEYLDILEHISGSVYICYDNDDTGVRQMQKMRDKYPYITPIWINDLRQYAIDKGRTAPLTARNIVFNDIADIASYWDTNPGFVLAFKEFIENCMIMKTLPNYT